MLCDILSLVQLLSKYAFSAKEGPMWFLHRIHSVFVSLFCDICT